MEQKLKQRLVGAGVIIAVGVIVIPMILDGAGERQLRKMPDAPKARIISKPGLVTEDAIPVFSRKGSGQIVITLPKDEVTESPDNNTKTKTATASDNKASNPKKPVVTAKVAEPKKARKEAESRPEIKPETKSGAKPAPASKPKSIPKSEPEPVVAAKKKAPAKATKKPLAKTSPTGIWVVQVGSFTDPKKAFKFRDNLRGKKYKAFVEKISGRSGKSLYRVRVGPMLKREQASNMAAKLQKQGTKGFVTRHP